MEISVRIYEEITGQSDLPPPVDEADYERRKHRRVPFGHRATITPERKGFDNTPAVVMVRDVSVGGVSFLHDEALKPGTPLTIEFKGHQDRPVQLHCAVARCETGGSGGAQFVVGAAFDAVLTEELPLPEAKSEPAEAKAPESKPAEVKRAKAEAIPTVAAPVVDATKTTDEQARTPDKLKKPAHAPEKSGAAPVTQSAPAPAKSSALFKAADPTAAQKPSEEYWSEGGPTDAAPQPAAAKPSPELSEPVFREVPLPDLEPEPQQQPEPQLELEDEPELEPGSELGTEPEPEKQFTAAPAPSQHSADHHGKNHEILARVKELLITQEQSIEKQRREMKEQRERFEKEIKSMRLELQDTRTKLAEIRTKSDEDESAIAELENFLKQHDRSKPPVKKNEAA